MATSLSIPAAADVAVNFTGAYAVAQGNIDGGPHEFEDRDNLGGRSEPPAPHSALAEILGTGFSATVFSSVDFGPGWARLIVKSDHAANAPAVQPGLATQGYGSGDAHFEAFNLSEKVLQVDVFERSWVEMGIDGNGSSYQSLNFRKHYGPPSWRDGFDDRHTVRLPPSPEYPTRLFEFDRHVLWIEPGDTFQGSLINTGYSQYYNGGWGSPGYVAAGSGFSEMTLVWNSSISSSGSDSTQGPNSDAGDQFESGNMLEFGGAREHTVGSASKSRGSAGEGFYYEAEGDDVFTAIVGLEALNLAGGSDWDVWVDGAVVATLTSNAAEGSEAPTMWDFEFEGDGPVTAFALLPTDDTVLTESTAIAVQLMFGRPKAASAATPSARRRRWRATTTTPARSSRRTWTWS